LTLRIFRLILPVSFFPSMHVIHSSIHHLHNPALEFVESKLVEYAESPDRADIIVETLAEELRLNVIAPREYTVAPVLDVHDAGYIAWLETAWKRWTEAGLDPSGVMPEFHPLGRLRGNLRTTSPLGLAGWYMCDSSAVIVEGTWEAAFGSACCALTGASLLLEGEPYAFALCRPPGHHAGRDFCGGYCFLNNAAIAAHYLTVNGGMRVCILDVDYHHGNGTQDIVASHPGLSYVSLHGDPDFAYPYVSGFRDENTDRIVNMPFEKNVPVDTYLGLFGEALNAVRDMRPGILVFSLGVDTHNEDPIGGTMLQSASYSIMARMLLASLSIPILIVMEGGYNTSRLGENVVSFLRPFMQKS
jgi:acetoin utilization deacetylase AcuC-like enzyme